MSSLLSQVQQLLLKRDWNRAKIDKGTCIAKLRTCKSQLETVVSIFTDEGSMFQEGVRLCDEMIQDCEANARVNQHALVNMACICKVIVLKCKAVMYEYKDNDHPLIDQLIVMEYNSDALGYEIDAFEKKCHKFEDQAHQYKALADRYRALARQHEDKIRHPRVWAGKKLKLQKIASEFTDRASEFETIARQSEDGVCIFERSVCAASEKGGIN
jgi:hypothetical protein